jgi:hypothetical protein
LREVAGVQREGGEKKKERMGGRIRCQKAKEFLNLNGKGFRS